MVFNNFLLTAGQIETIQNIIVWVPTVLFCLIIVLWVIRGITKGFRKSTIQFIYMLIAIVLSAVVFYVLTNNDGATLYSISKSVLGNSINTNETLNIIFAQNDNFIDGLKDVLLKYVAEVNGGLENVAIEIYSQLVPLAIIIMKLIAFTVCVICYYIFKFLFWILYLIFFKEKRHKKKLIRNGKKYRKHRIGGGIIGLVRGALVGTVTIGFIGTVVYVTTATRKPNENVTFTDGTLNTFYDWNNCLRALGDEGILKMFNNINVDNAPFYIFFANMIASAETEDGNTVYLTDELAAISGIAQDMVDVLGVYAPNISVNGNATEQMNIISDLLQSDAKLEYNGQELTFEEALISVVDKYQGTEYSKNFLKVTIGATIMGMKEIAPNSIYANTVTAMFEDTGDGNYLSPYDLVTFEDCKSLLKGVIKAGSEILDAVSYQQNNKDLLGVTNRYLLVVEPVYEAMQNLSIYTNYEEDTIINGEEIVANKKTKMNKALDNAADYFFTELANQQVVAEEDATKDVPFTNPYAGKEINWLDDFDSIVSAVGDVYNISSATEKVQVDEKLDFKHSLTKVFGDDYSEKDVINSSYEKLTDKISNVEAVNILFESDYMYEAFYDKFTTSLVQSINGSVPTSEINLPRDIKWGDTYDEAGNIIETGEFRTLFETIKDLIKERLLISIDFNNIDLVSLNNTFSILDKESDNNQTVLENMFDSKLLYYATSLIISNVNSNDIRTIVPEDDTYLHENQVLICREELVNLVDSARPVLNKLVDEGYKTFADLNSNMSKLFDIIADDEVKNSIISSDILTATCSNMVVKSTKGDSPLKEYLAIPTDYNIDEEEINQEVVKKWIGSEGEFSRLLNAITAIDLSDILDENANKDKMLDKVLLLNNSYKDTTIGDVVFASEVMSLSMSNMVTTNEDIKDYIAVPNAAYRSDYEEGKDNYIKTNEWINLVDALEKSFGVEEDGETPLKEQLENYDQLVRNVFKGDYSTYEDKKDTLFKSYILEYSMVKNIYSNLEGQDLGSDLTLIIPDYLKDNDYSNWLAIRNSDDEYKIDNYQELGNVFEVFKVTGLGEIYGQENFNEEAGKRVSVSSLIINKSDYNADGTISNKTEKLAKQDAINKSVVLTATTLNTILQTNAVSLPKDYIIEGLLIKNEDEKYIYDSELTPKTITEKYGELKEVVNDIPNIFSALNELELDVEEGSNVINIDADAILLLNDESIKEESNKKIDVISGSNVLSLTLTDTLVEASKIEKLPEGSYEPKLGSNFITNYEWLRIVDAIESEDSGLGIKENVEERLQEPQNLVKTLLGEEVTDNPESDENYVTRRNGVLSSLVLEELIVKNMKDTLDEAGNNPENNIVVPLDVNWHRKDAPETKSEVVVLLNVFKILGLGSEENIDYNEFINNNLQAEDILVLKDDNDDQIKHKEALQEEMLDSFVLYATMANNVYEVEVLSKPAELSKLENGVSLEETAWYQNKELNNLFEATKLLGLEAEDNTIKFNMNDILEGLVTKDDYNPIAELANSSIAYLTISNQVLEVALNEESNLKLILPYSEITKLTNYNENIIDKDELQAMLNDLDYLGINSFTGSGQDIAVPSEVNENMFSSSIIRATISKRIIEQTLTGYSSWDNIPYLNNNVELVNSVSGNVLDNGNYDVIESEDTYNIFSQVELQNFIKAINEFNTSADNSFTIKIEKVEDLRNVDASVLDSDIAYSIISKALLGLGDISDLEPTNVEGYLLTINSQLKNQNIESYSKEQIKSLMQA